MTICEGGRPIASQRCTCICTKAVRLTNTTDLLVSIHEKASNLKKPMSTAWHIQSQLVRPLSPKRVGTFLPICRIYPETRSYLTQYGCRKPFEPRTHYIWRKLRHLAGLGSRLYSCARPRRDICSELAMQLKRAEEKRNFSPHGSISKLLSSHPDCQQHLKLTIGLDIQPSRLHPRSLSRIWKPAVLS